MGRHTIQSIPLLATLLIVSPVLAAQEEHTDEPSTSQAEPAEAEEHEGAHEEHHHENEIALVVGGTYESEGEETLFTLGGEYSRVLSEVVSASLVVEHVDDVDSWVFVAPLKLRPWSGSELFFAVGPGMEHKSRRRVPGGEGHGMRSEGESESEFEPKENLFLWRFGLGYGFEVGKGVSITPGLDLDLVRENGEWVEAVVFDIAVGLGF